MPFCVDRAKLNRPPIYAVKSIDLMAICKGWSLCNSAESARRIVGGSGPICSQVNLHAQPDVTALLMMGESWPAPKWCMDSLLVIGESCPASMSCSDALLAVSESWPASNPCSDALRQSFALAARHSSMVWPTQRSVLGSPFACRLLVHLVKQTDMLESQRHGLASEC